MLLYGMFNAYYYVIFIIYIRNILFNMDKYRKTKQFNYTVIWVYLTL